MGNNLCSQIGIKKQNYNLLISDCIPNGLVSSLVKSIQAGCPSIDLHAVNNEYHRQRNKRIYFTDQVTNKQLASNASNTVVVDLSTEVARSMGEQLTGITDVEEN